MAKDFPVNEGEFLRISGVGMNKLERYGKVFIPIIKKYADKHGTGSKSVEIRTRKRGSRVDKPRHIQVGESYNDGKSIKELEEQFSVKTQTIISHLVRYTTEGRSVRTNGLAEMLTVDKKLHKKVFEHFNMEGTQQLSPAFEKFNQEISYLDLHILKLIYLNNNIKK
jgi:ATP-dependent DNA helicase RecQ